MRMNARAGLRILLPAAAAVWAGYVPTTATAADMEAQRKRMGLIGGVLTAATVLGLVPGGMSAMVENAAVAFLTSYSDWSVGVAKHKAIEMKADPDKVGALGLWWAAVQADLGLSKAGA